MIRILLVLSYIANCIKLRVAPWKYFQLNSPYFNEQRDIFSKLEMDLRIPEQWRLHQFLDIGDEQPCCYPVFVKPEWGQNSHGIQRADSEKSLLNIRKSRVSSRINSRINTGINYLIQEAAPGRREFEIFAIPTSENSNLPGFFSITETENNSEDAYPINGIYNRATTYRDITDQFTEDQLIQLWQLMKQMGHYRIARYGARANSIADLLIGKFHIIEINLFLPMPLVLLSTNRRPVEKITLCLKAMKLLARATQTLPKDQPHKPVFFKKLRQSKSLKLVNKYETK